MLRWGWHTRRAIPPRLSSILSKLVESRAKPLLLTLEIDAAYHSQLKSPSGGIQFHNKFAGAAGPGKPARASDKMDRSPIKARGGV